MYKSTLLTLHAPYSKNIDKHNEMTIPQILSGILVGLAFVPFVLPVVWDLYRSWYLQCM